MIAHLTDFQILSALEYILYRQLSTHRVYLLAGVGVPDRTLVYCHHCPEQNSVKQIHMDFSYLRIKHNVG